MEKVKPWKSKTLLMGLIAAVAPFIPGVDEWLKGNELLYSQGLALVFMLLRVATKGKLAIE